MRNWRFDQGRLQYFQFDEIKKIALALNALDGVKKPASDEKDVVREVLSKFSKLPFLPNHPQFARVKFSLRASALFAAIIALIFVALLNQAHAQLTWNDPANKQWSNNVATWNNNNW